MVGVVELGVNQLVDGDEQAILAGEDGGEELEVVLSAGVGGHAENDGERRLGAPVEEFELEVVPYPLNLLWEFEKFLLFR